jgi:hypothetical protein
MKLNSLNLLKTGFLMTALLGIATPTFAFDKQVSCSCLIQCLEKSSPLCHRPLVESMFCRDRLGSVYNPISMTSWPSCIELNDVNQCLQICSLF